VDIRQLNAVTIDTNPRTAITGGAARNLDLFDATAEGPLFLPGGTCFGVGLGGLVLGGGIGYDATASVANGLIAWTNDMIAVIAPYTPNESYQNFPNRLISDWEKAYYAENFERLVDVKTKYDNGNLFNNAQSIPPRRLVTAQASGLAPPAAPPVQVP
jgi:FAD/FMN-containing dehydrogenase